MEADVHTPVRHAHLRQPGPRRPGARGSIRCVTDTETLIARHFADRPFTLRQAMDLGITRGALRYACARGRLSGIGIGLYQAAPRPSFLDRARMAALRHPDAVLSHDAAAALHGMWCPWPSGWRRVMACSPTQATRQAHATLIRRRLLAVDVTLVDGMRCTTPARTALDIAAAATLPEALTVLDSVGRLDGPRRGEVIRPAYRDAVRGALLQAAGRMRHLRGVERARYAAALANPAAESAAESYARGLFLAAGHPEPLVGRPVRGADGRTYYADLCWPGQRLIVEIDGAEKYQSRGDLLAEKRREDAIRAAGFGVQRILAGDLWRQPNDVIPGRRTA